ncbi:MAG: PilZ domain-containing protein [Syntrophaceae bacterium]|nr:PilZ domain-containing protein [Syntrophaceae bacterium]
MVFGKFLGKQSKTSGPFSGLDTVEALQHIERLETAIFQISSALKSNKDTNKFLEMISQESLHFLRAHRSTFFSLDPKGEALKIKFTHALDPRYQQVGLVEEKEIAKRALRQSTPLLLAGPESFSRFFKYEERDNKITSLLSVSVGGKGKPVGVISAALINGNYVFDERSAKCISSLANFASLALEISDMLEEVQKGNSVRTAYEGHLDNILSQLQSLSQKEQQRINTHIIMIKAEQESDPHDFLESQVNGKVPWAEGTILLKDESREKERAEIKVRVEFDEEHWGSTDTPNLGGAFVLTANPMDLGDEFLLKFGLPDGREPVAGECKVVWTNKYGKESEALRRGMGIKFLSLPEENRIRIEEFVKSFRARLLEAVN